MTATTATPPEYTSWSYGEAHTARGQLVRFECPSERKDEVRQFFAEQVLGIDLPTTGRATVGHGGYGRCTRYDIVQHRYAGGGHEACGGFIEVLEIRNPPDNRAGVVIHEWDNARGAVFSEWERVEHAIAAFESQWGNSGTAVVFPTLPGFCRRVVCNKLTPWFYAIANQRLVGDYAFPEGLQDDVVFRFGAKFLVYDANGIPCIKTCMGTRFLSWTHYYTCHEDRKCHGRLVFWDDGTVWDEAGHYIGGSSKYPPRPLCDDETWISQAIEQFYLLLAGRQTEFSIPFLDGTVFTGKVKQNESRVHCAEGQYLVTVYFTESGKEPRNGTMEFVPTADAPDVVTYVTAVVAKKGWGTIDRIEVKDKTVERGGKKWAGVFFCRTP